MKFYVLRPQVSVPNEVNIFGPHLQIRLVRRGDTTCSFGLLRLNTTRQTNKMHAWPEGLGFSKSVECTYKILCPVEILNFIII
jgi:hypothetical protein